MFFVRLFLLIIHLLLTVLLTACLLNEWISPINIAFLNFLSLTFPIFQIIYLVLTLFWIFSYRKRAYFFLFAMVLFFNPTRKWINYSPNKKTSEKTVKIVSYNVYNGKESYEKIMDYLKKQDADFYFLQESGYEQESRVLSIDHYQKPILFPLVSLISKYPIIKQGLVFENNSTNGRSFYADANVNGKIIRLINVYLEPFAVNKMEVMAEINELKKNPKLNNFITSKMMDIFKIHAEQVNQIQDFIQKSPYPVIVACDANATPNSYEYFHLSKGLKDGFLEVGSGLGTTFHDWKFPIRIDYVFASPSLPFIDYQIDRSIHLSDHFPTISTLKINQN